MEGLGRLDLAHADHHHLRQAALDRSRKTGVQLHTIHDQYTGRLIAVAVHPDVTRRHAAHSDALHAGPNRHSHRGFGNAQRLDHLPLALGGGTVVGAHTGDNERLSSPRTQPVASGLDNLGDVRDPPAPGGDGDVALGDIERRLVELLSNGGRNITQGTRPQLLVHSK